jgi:hypothetical protein
MPRRIILYSLIALCLVQEIGAAHSHDEVSWHDPSGVYRPRHFHLLAALPWLRIRQDPCEPLLRQRGIAPEVVDHDADAVYLPDSEGSDGRVRPVLTMPELTTAHIPLLAALLIGSDISLAPSTPLYDGAVPIFLFSAPLRI